MIANESLSKQDMNIYPKLLLFSLLFLLSCIAKAQSPNILTKTISFKSNGIVLIGTILKPSHSKVGVVIIHGSGQERRAMQFASLLANNGMTVFTYDKRGVGESGGEYAGPEVGTNNIDSTNLNLLAEDAKAAVLALDNYLENEPLPIGLLGFSQAGWIIPIAANKCPKVDFMVIFSGAVIPTLEQLRFQFLTEGNQDFWLTHSEAEVRAHIRHAPDRYQFITTDPQESLRTLSIPGLWLFGGNDIQVPVGLSMERLDGLRAEGKPFEYHLYPDLGHNLTFSDTTQPVKTALHWIKSLADKTKR